MEAEVLTLLEEQVAFHCEQLERASRLLERARAAVAVRREVTPGAVSVKLRRLCHQGVINAVREDWSQVESLYEKPASE